MPKTKLRIYIGLFILISFLTGGAFYAYAHTHPPSLCHNLSCINFQGMTGYQPKEIYTDSPATYRALYSKDDRLFRIEVQKVNPDEAQKELAAGVIRVKAQFEKAPAPYPGDLSDTITCDPHFIPTFEETQNQTMHLSLFTGYLNNRLTFGSCSENQAAYRGILVFTMCPKHKLLIRIEHIASLTDFEAHGKELMDQIKTLSCRNDN